MIKRPREPSTNYDLTDRDMPEKIWLWRHRQPSDMGLSRGRRAGAMSQAEAAEKLGLSTQQYIKLESGETTLLSATDLAKLGWWVSEAFNNQTVSDSELCFLARRRSGLSVKEVAEELSTSAQTYTKMEAEANERVMRFWRLQGYKFVKGQRTIRRPGTQLVQRPA
jgi:DNA-binding XRE family transcriptional regulator